MSLRPGQSLAHFRLIDKIGEGGMGEVWRAVDTTLDREVAVKVLPAAFSRDPERLLRLEREAKLLAALNHPNIAAIYGFPEVTIAPGETLRFLAMELVRGEDLAEILARGPMPIGEAQDAARQIAAALEAAHDNGVIHRDLKPANVKRTPDGQIKVLDFGLAKALESASPSSGQMPTVTSAGTQAGIILGTASYMSPEQARGQNVDRRTDLWAFGCVLFEMLSGAKAFDGPTVTDVLAAVVTGSPDWSKLPAATPISMRRLLRRCLEKDARKRLRDAGDASLLLDDNPEDQRSGPVPAVEVPRSKRAFALPAAALLVAIAGLGGGLWLARRASAATVGSSVIFHRITYSRGMVRSARFAPDGQTIVYGASWGGPPVKLYLARTDSPEATQSAVPPAELLAISKGGEMAIALGLRYYGWMGDGTLARTPLLGGSPREIIEHVRSADWSPDGTQFAIVHRVNGLDQLEYPVGTVLDKTTGYFEQARISPDGKLIAYADHPAWGDNLGNLAIVDTTGKKTALASDFPAIQGVAWAPGGKEVWFSAINADLGRGLYAVDLSGHRRLIYAVPDFIELLDIAPDGRVLLACQRQEREAQGLLAGFTEPRPLIVPGESSIVRTVSADGRSVLVTNQIPKDYETFVIRSDRPGASRLSQGEGLAISPDGSASILSSANFRQLSIQPLGMGAPRAIPNPDGIGYLSIPGWMPDGKQFVVAGRKGTDPSRGYLIDVATGSAKAFAAPGVAWSQFTGPPVSPDGRYVVLEDKDGTAKRWPVAGGEAISIPGLLPDELATTWSEDGAALYVAGRALPIPITRIELATGRRTPMMTMAPTDSAGLRYATATISPNGKYWAMGTAKMLSDLYIVEGLR